MNNINNKEVVKEIKNIFKSIKCSCYIDSLIRIDENIYDCENCILADTVDTVSTVREGMVDKSICPMIMEEEVKILR